jgi:hypothetical protein
MPGGFAAAGPVGRVMEFDLDYLGDDRWQLRLTYSSGKLLLRKGDLEQLMRLALRAQQLLAFWAQSRAVKTTIPASPVTIPATPSAIRPRPLRSTLRARAEELKRKWQKE